MASFPTRKTYTYQDLIKMSTEELKKVRKTLRDSTTRKIRKLNKKGVTSNPAIARLTKKIKEGKVRPIKQIRLSKSQMKYLSKVERSKKLKQAEYDRRQELIKEALNYQSFNQAKTSTYKGWEEYQKYLEDILGDGYKNLSDKEKSKFWEMYNEQKQFIEDHLHDDSLGILKWLTAYLDARNAKHVGTKKDKRVFKEFLDNLNDERIKEAELNNTKNDMMNRTQGFINSTEKVFTSLNK